MKRRRLRRPQRSMVNCVIGQNGGVFFGESKNLPGRGWRRPSSGYLSPSMRGGRTWYCIQHRGRSLWSSRLGKSVRIDIWSRRVMQEQWTEESIGPRLTGPRLQSPSTPSALQPRNITFNHLRTDSATEMRDSPMTFTPQNCCPNITIQLASVALLFLGTVNSSTNCVNRFFPLFAFRSSSTPTYV